MNTNPINSDDLSEDERFLRAHPLFDRATYNARLDHAARNLSVAVNAARTRRATRIRRLLWAAPVSAVAALLTIVVLLREDPFVPAVTPSVTTALVTPPAPATVPDQSLTQAPPTATETVAHRPVKRRTLGVDELTFEPLVEDAAAYDLAILAEEAILDQFNTSDGSSENVLNLTSTDIDRLAKGYDDAQGY